MDILVLLKQVPATDSVVSIADDGKSIATEDLSWVINPYDEFAVEEALRIKETHGGSVTILCVGKEKTTEAIRTALAMGADKGILINDNKARTSDSLRTAKILAGALKDISHDVIITGQRAVDYEGFQVGPAVAELLGIPNISMVINQEIVDGTIKCQRTVEGGVIVTKAPLPVLITTQRGLNDPRYASLPGIMKAKKKPIETKSIEDVGIDPLELDKIGVRVEAMTLPPERKAGKIIDMETDQAKAAELVRALHEEAKVI